MLPTAAAPYIILLIVLAVLWLGWRMVIRRCEAANETDWGNPWLNRLDGLNRLLCRHYHRLRSPPLPLSTTGPALLVSNHVSGLDPLLLIAASRRPLRFLIASEQYHRFGLTWLFRAVGCIPVDRGGRPERAFREALRALAQGEVVALFPHGTIHLDDDPPRRLKQGVAKMAHLSLAPVYPVRLTGIKGAGRVVQAVFQRSHAQLQSFPAVDCAALSTRACLDELQATLDGKADQGSSA